jgi:hypothetical protein
MAIFWEYYRKEKGGVYWYEAVIRVKTDKAEP